MSWQIGCIALILCCPSIFSAALTKRPDRLDGNEVKGVVEGILAGNKQQRAVQLRNELAEPLRIDCGSEEDDLGNLVIQPGHAIVWSFPADEKTWYECELWGNGRHKVFEIFPGPRAGKQKKTFWSARFDGIYDGVMTSKRDIHGKRILIRPKRIHLWNTEENESDRLLL